MDQRLISIVVPVYNEEESLDALVSEIRAVSAKQGYRVQVLFVDDGSRDASWERIRALAAVDPDLGGLRFRRNAGKAAALNAGFSAATGELVFMMDADLQDPPEEMPRLIARLDEGYDVVSGWKKTRHDPWHKVYPSRVFNRLIGMLTGVKLHDHVCGLKCFRGEVVKELCVYGEFHRFLGVLAAARGFRVTEIPTLHRARCHGVGKYGFTRFFKGFLDLLTVVFLTRYRWRPQHLIGVSGILVALVSLLAMVPRIGLFILPAVVAAIFIAIGLVAELVVARSAPEQAYVIADRTGWCEEAPPGAQATPADARLSA